MVAVSESGTISQSSQGILEPVLVPVFFSSKVSTALWRRGPILVAPRVAFCRISSSSPRRGNLAPAEMKYWMTPVSWQLGRSSLSAACWFLSSDLTEDFSDKFRTDVWWVGGTNASGDYLVDASSNTHGKFLRITHDNRATFRLFR